ncbi:MAG: 23S rRNA (uracil(1939)-C(5))-methyltransferase RlmD [Gammaproteobacteria bacterium]|nr:23S rRNA (uracil(1939)-C(5))-methyltransferase RlmD [Gammaproteobacteria bacterium]
MSRSSRLPQEVTIEVVELTLDGSGRGWVEEREVRLRNSLPGERATGVIRKRARGVLHGDAQKIESPDVDRILPPCSVFSRCGACNFQHLAPKSELRFKQSQVLDLLRREGVVPQRVRRPVTSPLFGYRRKARLGIRKVGEQVFVGFREAFSGRIVDMQECPVLDPRLAALIKPLREAIAASSIPDQIPQIEVAAGDDSTALVLRHLAPLSAGDMQLFSGLAEQFRTSLWLQPGGPDSIVHVAGASPVLSYGNPDFGLLFQFGPLDFVQVNSAINRALVQSAVAALADCGDVLDLFCGLGNFSLALARAGHRVSGLEAGDQAVRLAEHNAAFNGLSALTRFETADLYGPAGESLDIPASCDGLLLDPPRLGAGPNLFLWLESAIRRVVYVSCNPVTFAADARVLNAHGFQLEEVGVFDMFPRTAHVESFGIFERRRSGVLSPGAETIPTWSR